MHNTVAKMCRSLMLVNFANKLCDVEPGQSKVSLSTSFLIYKHLAQ